MALYVYGNKLQHKLQNYNGFLFDAILVGALRHFLFSKEEMIQKTKMCVVMRTVVYC